MPHSISLSDDFYKIVSHEAQNQHRTVPMQLVHWSRKARALQLSLDNPWLDVYNAELLLESSENKNGEVIDVNSYFKSLS